MTMPNCRIPVRNWAKTAAKAFAAFAVSAAAGCASYSWRPAIPEDGRTVAVPVFRNDSSTTELGDAVARETLREIQREGTFKIAPAGEAAWEIRGVVKNASSSTVAYERRTGARNREHLFTAVATVSFIDSKSGRVAADGRKYKARTTFLSNDDTLTGERDASGRLAADLARQITDDLVSIASGEAKRTNANQ